MAYPIPTQPPPPGLPTRLPHTPPPPPPSSLPYTPHAVSRATYPIPALPTSLPCTTHSPSLPSGLPYARLTLPPSPSLPSRLPYTYPATQAPNTPTPYPIPASPSPERPTLCPPPGRQTPKSPSSVLLQPVPRPAYLPCTSRVAYPIPLHPGIATPKTPAAASSTRPTPHTTSLTPKSPTLYPPDLRGRNLLLSPAGLPYTAARPVSKTPNNHKSPPVRLACWFAGGLSLGNLGEGGLTLSRS